MKGGQVEQGFFQSNFFYNFMTKHNKSKYITNNYTYVGLMLLNQYNDFDNLTVLPNKEFMTIFRSHEFLKKHKNEYLLASLPLSFFANDAIAHNQMTVEVANNKRKLRKICYLPLFGNAFRDSYCDVSVGGRIFKIDP